MTQTGDEPAQVGAEVIMLGRDDMMVGLAWCRRDLAQSRAMYEQEGRYRYLGRYSRDECVVGRIGVREGSVAQALHVRTPVQVETTAKRSGEIVEAEPRSMGQSIHHSTEYPVKAHSLTKLPARCNFVLF